MKEYNIKLMGGGSFDGASDDHITEEHSSELRATPIPNTDNMANAEVH